MRFAVIVLIGFVDGSLFRRKTTRQKWDEVNSAESKKKAVTYSRGAVEKGEWIPIFDSRTEELVNGYQFNLGKIATIGLNKLIEAHKVQTRTFMTKAYHKKMDAIFPKTFDYVFKYMPECGLSSEAVNEYAIAKALDGAGLTPRVYALSLPVEVDAGSVISKKMPGDCPKNPTKPEDLGSQNGESISNPAPALIVVRAILQDKVGKTLEEYFKGVQSKVLNKVDQQSYRARHEWVGIVVAAIQLGIKSVELVRAFHSSGFLHNDINHRNIALRGTSPKELVLINFGKATPVPQADLGASREDLFAVVEIVAALLTTSFWRSLESILDGQSSADRVTYRANTKYFSEELYRVSADTNDIPRVPEKGQSICAFYFGQAGGGTYSTRCGASMSKLDDALTLLRRSVDVTAPYSAVSGLMKEAISAISLPMKDRFKRAIGLQSP